jgi:predicted DCC family thiol-disulfide oxidoreductase YuxK
MAARLHSRARAHPRSARRLTGAARPRPIATPADDPADHRCRKRATDRRTRCATLDQRRRPLTYQHQHPTATLDQTATPDQPADRWIEAKVGLSHQDETVRYRTRIEAASILYDADCGFCRWSLAQLLRLDRHSRLRPVSLQDPEAGILLSGMPHELRMASWHLVDDAGRVHSGGNAFSPLVRLIAGWDRFARVLAAFPSLSDLTYRTVARQRSWLGRLIPAASSARARQRIQAAANRQPSGVDRHRRSQTGCP